MTDMAQDVTGIIAKVAKREPSDISPDTRIAEDLGIKSVGRVEIAAHIEDQLGINLGNFEIRKPKTVGEVIALVESKG